MNRRFYPCLPVLLALLGGTQKRTVTAVALMAGLLLAACQQKEEAPKSDQEKLQGTWTLKFAVVDGQEKTREFVKVGYEAVIKGDKITLGGSNEKRTATFLLDPASQPKTFDMVVVAYGIYELNENELKLCFGGGKRPTEFDGEAGSQNALFIFKRARP